MSMTCAEAMKIATDTAASHAPVTFDLAGTVLREHAGGRSAALVQLCELKAAIARAKPCKVGPMRQYIHAAFYNVGSN